MNSNPTPITIPNCPSLTVSLLLPLTKFLSRTRTLGIGRNKYNAQANAMTMPTSATFTPAAIAYENPGYEPPESAGAVQAAGYPPVPGYAAATPAYPMAGAGEFDSQA